MKDARVEWRDAAHGAVVSFADVTGVAQTLAGGHLSGPASAYFLSRALAAAALLGADARDEGEVLSLQMKCEGPLGGFNVEYSSKGSLRGYTHRKTLDGFDGAGSPPDPRRAVGATRLSLVRSVPGRVVSQSVADSLDALLAGPLGRRARILLESSVDDASRVLEARGILIEALPDGGFDPAAAAAPLEDAMRRRAGVLAAAPRTILGRLGLARAEKVSETPLSFACTCSRERAEAAVAASAADGGAQAAGREVCVTCHMCGRTYAVRVP